MKKYIELIKKLILEQIDENRGIETLKVDFKTDSFGDPIIKIELKTYSKK